MTVLLSPPQIPAGLKGFLGIPEDSSGLHYNLSDFELEENNSVKSSGVVKSDEKGGRMIEGAWSSRRGRGRVKGEGGVGSNGGGE